MQRFQRDYNACNFPEPEEANCEYYYLLCIYIYILLLILRRFISLFPTSAAHRIINS